MSRESEYKKALEKIAEGRYEEDAITDSYGICTSRRCLFCGARAEGPKDGAFVAHMGYCPVLIAADALKEKK